MAERYRLAPGVAWVDGTETGDAEPVAWATRVPDGSPVMLEGPAWLVWVALAESTSSDTVEEIVERVERIRDSGPRTDGPERGMAGPVAADDVRVFLDHLAGVGLVEGR